MGESTTLNMAAVGNWSAVLLVEPITCFTHSWTHLAEQSWPIKILFWKEMNTFVYQGNIKLQKIDIEDIYSFYSL